MEQGEILEQRVEELAEAALGIRAHGHAPYSNFQVGAAVLDERGRIHLGVNVENAAYPNGICAETTAIAAMVTAGGKRIVAIAVVGGGEGFCTPCGGCRQRIREFASEGTPILLVKASSEREVITLGELLPKSFGPENLVSPLKSESREA